MWPPTLVLSLSVRDTWFQLVCSTTWSLHTWSGRGTLLAPRSTMWLLWRAWGMFPPLWLRRPAHWSGKDVNVALRPPQKYLLGGRGWLLLWSGRGVPGAPRLSPGSPGTLRLSLPPCDRGPRCAGQGGTPPRRCAPRRAHCWAGGDGSRLGRGGASLTRCACPRGRLARHARCTSKNALLGLPPAGQHDHCGPSAFCRRLDDVILRNVHVKRCRD